MILEGIGGIHSSLFAIVFKQSKLGNFTDMRLRVISLLVFISSLAMGQGKYDANWCFGVKSGIDFNDTAHLRNFSTFANSAVSAATISDSSGNLLFYCAPDTPFHYYSIYGGVFEAIFDNNNRVIRNGDSIIHGYGISGEIFVPIPGKPDEFLFFYLPTLFDFSTDTFGNPVSAQYTNLYSTHIIKDSLGYKVLKKNQLLSNDKLERGITATKHANGKDWWLLVHNCNLQQTSNATNRYYRYLITSDSILGPFYQDIGTPHLTYYSCLSDFAFSPSGNRLASALDDQLIGELYDFNRCTGELSNCSVINSMYTNGGEIAGCVFSPDESKVYFSKGNGDTQFDNAVIQYSIDSPNVNATKVVLFDSVTHDFSFGEMRLAPDNKIYLAVDKGGIKPYYDNNYGIYNQYLWRINNPDSSGTACNFQPFAHYLGDSARVYWSLPKMPNYNLGALSIYQAGIISNTSICSGDSVGITIGSPAINGVTYSWQGINITDPTLAQPMVKPTQSSWYYVTLTDTTIRYSCQSRTDSVYVEVRNCCDTLLLSLVSAGRDTFFCRDSTHGVPIGVASVTGVAYQWHPSTGLSDATTAQPTAMPDADTYYILFATDTSRPSLVCPAKTDTVFVRVEKCDTTGINELPLQKVRVYPNPASNQLTIELSDYSKPIACKFYNAIGEEILQVALAQNRTSIDISSFPNGLYFYRLLENNSFQSGKFIIAH